MKHLEIDTEEDQIAEMPLINRVEVVDREGRAYVNEDARCVAVSIQNSGQTLKVILL